MLKTRELRIRLKEDQYFKIKGLAMLLGFPSMSEYVRCRLIRVPYRMERQLREIRDKLGAHS